MIAGVFAICVSGIETTSFAPGDLIIHKEQRTFISKSKRKYLKKELKEELADTIKTARNYIQEGNRKAQTGDPKGAFFDYSNALLISPGNAEALYYRGHVQVTLQEFANAIRDFSAAIEADSQSVELYFSRGNANYEMHNFSEAMENYSLAIKLDSTDKELYFNRGVVEFNLAKEKDGCNDFYKASSLGDDFAKDALNVICKE